MQSASPEEIDELISVYGDQLNQEASMTNPEVSSQMSSMASPTDTTAIEQGVGAGGLPPELGGELANSGQIV